ncbi:uncharacterized protein L3040_006372 [Drepanopeziza brunnea f. sp. 'multigermtubi']|uniref:Uncharacterized protein n=1 Tax=Marssonina brunnea f. sp. multigermtubi (strain MB_m1) TaxID=1072389 RepID=K1XJ00_MARBU|nr:uncharacterized protein MBM_01330 [Drepanopeziza brunnea f. sp. 'multigermtubi' MB_m1]EKD20648.1 hypothetical protein MBM_01330 [Drepanopeziza brunnea f. sp. 'multigermtubi' MB_m1]KAJ5038692.1 hypothetical protein L3040_006372 [Drepanopeziza brunnea f. sp. 'multigermtubi']
MASPAGGSRVLIGDTEIDFDTLNKLEWGEDTDHLFNQPGLKWDQQDHRGERARRLLAKFLEQKLIYRIETLIDHSQKISYDGRDCLASVHDVYEWQFTRDYPGFPQDAMYDWSLKQIRECNNALENGDLSLVDARPSKLWGEREREDRKRLVDIAEAAFTQYIAGETGSSKFHFKDVLMGNIGNQAFGLPGWRWIFPDLGLLTSFPPQKNSFGAWSNDEILHALQALLTKSLKLERIHSKSDPAAEAQTLQESQRLQQALLEATRNRPMFSLDPEHRYPPRPEFGHDYDDPVSPDSEMAYFTERTSPPLLKAPATKALVNSSSINANMAVPEPASGIITAEESLGLNGTPKIASAATNTHGLDDLITLLSERAQKWEADRERLQNYEKRENDLVAQIAVKSTRVAELEAALKRIKDLGEPFSSHSGSGSGTDNFFVRPANAESALDAMETFYTGQLADLNAQNEELMEVIADQEIQVKEAVSIRQRNRALEKELAEKTLEASSALKALARFATASGSANSILNGRGPNGTSKPPNTGGNYPSGRPPPSQYQPFPGPPVAMLPASNAKMDPRCDRCCKAQYTCQGKPCTRCQTDKQACTFNMEEASSVFVSPQQSARELDIRETTALTKTFSADAAWIWRATPDNTLPGQYPPKPTEYDSQFASSQRQERLFMNGPAYSLAPIRKTIDGLPGGSSGDIARQGGYKSIYSTDN